MRGRFEESDVDKDGILDREELVNAMQVGTQAIAV